MKHIKHILFLASLLLSNLTVSAEKVEINGIWYNLVSKAKVAEVTSSGGKKYSGTITIPTTVTYEGVQYSVTSIGESAFDHCISLVSVTLPESVTSIGNHAFYFCSNLTIINIPKECTKIGRYAFYDCNITTIAIPEGVTNIGDYAFSYCTNLTSINISGGVISIGTGAFSYCSKITSINIPESVTSIGGVAFNKCSSLTSINIPKGVTKIEDYTFSDCSSLSSITIPEGVIWVLDEAFSGCNSLTSINIPESVIQIGDQTFYGCSSLTSIVLPSSLRLIGSESFAYCTELTDVYCSAKNVPSSNTNAFNGSYPEYVTLHVPASAQESYQTTSPWSEFGTILSLTEDKVTSITLSQSSAILSEGQTMTLSATVEPSSATDKTITWSSSDSNVATVDDEGKVTAITPGTTTITATANGGSGVSASCVVTVEAMPTEVEITINQYGSGTYCSEYALDFSQVEGLKAYAAAGYNDVTGVVTLLRVMTTQPGTGLFVKGEPGTYEVPVIESSSDHTINMLVGTLVKTPVNKTSDDGLYRNFRYTTKTGVPTPMFYEIADGYTLSANRAYLQIPTAWLPAETKSIALRFDEGEGTTDIDPSTLNPQLSTEVYDLQGRRIDNPTSGIYIIDGKKVVIK